MAGNRTQQQLNTGGGPTTTNYSYDAANRLTSDGPHSFTYDAAGRMTGDGQSGFSYVWDRASRLLSFGDNFALYNGLDQRVEYTEDVIPPVTTRYVPDMIGGLWTVLASDTDNDVTGYVHGPTGLLQQVDPGGASHWILPDGQGNVRGVVNNSATVEESRLFSPYGEGYGFTGSVVTKYGYTGEPTNENGLVYVRARHYHPTFGVFPSLDPLEGEMAQPLSLNRYMWLLGNVVNGMDPSGLAPTIPGPRNSCMPQVRRIIPGPEDRDRDFSSLLQQSDPCNAICRQSCKESPDIFARLLPNLCQLVCVANCQRNLPSPTPQSTVVPTVTTAPTVVPSPTQPAPTSTASATNTATATASATATTLFPVFGYGAERVPAILANDYSSNHAAIDIVPIGVYVTPNSTFVNPTWDEVSPTAQHNQVFAVVGGTLTAFLRSNGSCCDAFITSTSSAYPNREFVYIHIQLDPPLGNQGQRPVRLGDPIGRIASYKVSKDPLAGDITHLHFAVRIPGTLDFGNTFDPKLYMPTGIIVSDAQKLRRSP